MVAEGFTGPRPGLGRDVALVGGRVVPVGGDPIGRGTVLVLDGRVAALGPVEHVPVPDRLPVHDTTGLWVLPGLVEAHAHVGIYEDGVGPAGMDHNDLADPDTARLRALDAVNPADIAFADALAGGVTTVVVKPGSGNVIGGRCAALKTWGRTVDAMCLREPVAIKSALGENPKRVHGERKQLPSTRMGVAAVVRDACARATHHRQQLTRAASGRIAAPNPDLNAESVLLALEREIPWCQHAHRADDIATALRLAREHGYRLVLHHGTEAHLLAEEIVNAGVPVVVGPQLVSRSKVELRQRTLRTPGLLAAAGALVALTTDHPVVPIGLLILQAMLSMKEGLEPHEALRAVTVNPARIMGIDDRVGTLQPGRDADVVVWDGDPLELMSRVVTVYVEGRRVYDYDRDARVGRAANPWG